MRSYREGADKTIVRKMCRKSFFGNSTDHPGRHKETAEKAERWLMIAKVKPLQRQ